MFLFCLLLIEIQLSMLIMVLNVECSGIVGCYLGLMFITYFEFHGD